jgi:hypothetical protein
MRIFGSVPLINGSGCGFGTQVHLHHSSQIKIHKEVTKQQKSRFFQIKIHKEVTKQQKSRFFLLFLLMMEVSGALSVLVTNGSGCGSGSPTLVFKEDFFCLGGR